jgi:hypothetical protein
MYPELVPSGGFKFLDDLQGAHRRIAFTESEDKCVIYEVLIKKCHQ